MLLITNCRAGSVEAETLDAAVPALTSRSSVERVETTDAAELDHALDGFGGGRLVVAGGDGSVHALVAALLHRDPELLAATEIAVVPLGTGNDLARGVGIPLEAAEAAALAAAGRAAPADLLVTDDGDVVVNVAHAGLGAVAAERAAGLKDTLGPLAYPVGALVAGATERGYALRVLVDDVDVHEGPALMVAVANGPSIGGGTLVAPGALVDDGLVDVVVSTAVGAAARVAFGVALRSGEHLDRDDVVLKRGRRVAITGDPVGHDLDGELGEPLASRQYTLVPAAWRLVRP